MGAASSSDAQLLVQPQEVSEFRKLTNPENELAIPELPEKRKVTDFQFVVLLGLCLALLFPFMIYSFVNADIDRFTHGYDKCGNVCGRNNTRIDGIPCSGKDERNLPFLKFERDGLVRLREYDCVESCDPEYYNIIFNLCVPAKQDESDAVMQKVADAVNKSAGHIVALCFIGLGFSIGMLVLFRYFVAFVVWTVLIGSLVGILIFTTCLWYTASTEEDVKFFAIFCTVASVVLVVMLICMFKRIKLIIRLFKEAIRVIFGIPLILIEPVLTLVASTVLMAICFVFFAVWGTAGTLQKVSFDTYDYVPNAAVLFTMFLHGILCLWFYQFIVGCQHMVVSGAVSAYYFARDKSSLRSPIYNSFYNLIRYHLGTVVFGSLIITIITVIKLIVQSLRNHRLARVFIKCCLSYIEQFLKYLSKNAYILTAIHGQPFYKSGKRAADLLTANVISTIALNCVGDFVLNMAKLLIVICTIGVGFLIRDPTIEYYGAAVFIAAIVTAIVANCFFTVFETAVDTIYLCFCEDNLINDGMERPYYMSINLMKYMEEAKKHVEAQK